MTRYLTKVVMLPTAELEYLNGNDNPQALNPDLLESVREHGIVNPLVLHANRRKVLIGNQRLRVAQELGIAEVPCVIIDGQNAPERAAQEHEVREHYSDAEGHPEYPGGWNMRDHKNPTGWWSSKPKS